MKQALAMRTAVFSVSLLMALPSLDWAAGTGTTAAQFLEIGVGARATGMAGAYTAVTDDAEAIYWNPAGAAQATQQQVAATFNNLYQETSQGYIGYIHPMEKSVWGAAVDYLQVAGIEERTADTYNPNYTFTARDTAFMLSYARPDVIIPNLSLGANIKYIQSYIDTAYARDWAIDGGALYQVPGIPLRVGASIQNVDFGMGMKYVSATDAIPLGLKGGVAYDWAKPHLLLVAGIDDWVRDQRSYEELGLEWKPISAVALRTGYQFGHAQDQLGSSWVGYSVGIGLNWKMISLDYAYVPFGDLGTTQQFSLAYRFGEGSVSRQSSHPIMQSKADPNNILPSL